MRARRQNCVSRTRVYPYQDLTNLRSEEDTLEYAKQSCEVQKAVCGVKGPTIISKICNKFITSTAIDVMHCVFEGIVKRLGELWFQPKYSNEKFSVSNFVELVDFKLSLIKPPAFIARRPRSVGEHFSHWKASELKDWFFYYSIPIMESILPTEYFDHYKYLVLGINILCQERITREEIDFAETVIHEFLLRFENLYGLKYMTCNTHSLGHLHTIVRRLGPLWTTSCFPLEDLNGKFKRYVHSSNHPHLQIVSNLSMYLKLYILNDEWIKSDSDAFTFCKQLECSKKRLKLTKLDDYISIVGVASRIKTDEAANILLNYNLKS